MFANAAVAHQQSAHPVASCLETESRSVWSQAGELLRNFVTAPEKLFEPSGRHHLPQSKDQRDRHVRLAVIFGFLGGLAGSLVLALLTLPFLLFGEAGHSISQAVSGIGFFAGAFFGARFPGRYMDRP